MRIIIIIIILLGLVYISRTKLKEKFSSFYPGKDIEIHEKWIKTHVNNSLIKRDHIGKYLKLLTTEFDILFYSTLYNKIIEEHKIKKFDDKVPFIIDEIIVFLRRFEDTSIKEDRLSSFSQPEYIKLTDHLIEYLDCNVYHLKEETIRDSCTKRKDDKIIVNYTDNGSNKKYFENGKVKEYKLANNIHLIHKYFTTKDNTKLTELFNQILDKYYIDNDEESKYKFDNYLPCAIYDQKKCPLDKCIFNPDNNVCMPKENSNKNIFNNPIEDCNSISLYGKEYCNRTSKLSNNNTLEDCRYQEKTRTCLNPEDSDNITCEEIAGDGDNFKTNCESLKDPDDVSKNRCDYLSKTNGDNEYKFCVDKKTKNHNAMTCMNFSSILNGSSKTPVLLNEDETSNTDKDILDKYNCKKVEDNGIDYYYNPSYTPESKVTNMDCGIFDNSNYLRNRTDTIFIKKRNDQKYRVSNTDKQEEICKGNIKCKFTKLNTYNNKEMTKCLPINYKLTSNFLDDNIEGSECRMNGYKYMGKSGSQKCLDINSNCNDIKYKNLCDQKDNKCFWNPGLNDINDGDDKFERGYCMNMDIIGLEKVIDNYHNDEISKIAKYKNLQNEFNNLNVDAKILEGLKQKLNPQIIKKK